MSDNDEAKVKVGELEGKPVYADTPTDTKKAKKEERD